MNTGRVYWVPMSQLAPVIDLARRYSFEEYYRILQMSETKYEFVDGKLIDIRAMAGGTEGHSEICVNILIQINAALAGKPCRIFNSDLAVRARHMARYRYPDASIACGGSEFGEDDPKHYVLLNPRVIFEVLSPTTESVDRDEKFGDYRAIDSLRQYVLVSQSKPQIESYFRRDDGTWLFQYWTGLEAVARLQAVEVDLPLHDVYAGVKFSSDADAAPDATGKPST